MTLLARSLAQNQFGADRWKARQRAKREIRACTTMMVATRMRRIGGIRTLQFVLLGFSSATIPDPEVTQRMSRVGTVALERPPNRHAQKPD